MPEIELVGGYFTIERNIERLSTQEMETALGFQPGYLSQGCRILGLLRYPTLAQFVQRGSTLYSGGQGLDPVEMLRTNFTPMAWRNQRLIKVKSRSAGGDWSYPSSASPVEQWELLIKVEALEITTLDAGDVYYGGRKRGGPWPC